MAKVTIQYWAAARDAAGVAAESVEAGTLAEALEVIVARRAGDGRLRSVLATSSFLVDGAPASRRTSRCCKQPVSWQSFFRSTPGR